MTPVRLALLLTLGLVAACDAADAPLVPAAAISAGALDQPLADVPGDPVRGRAAFVDEARGHCVLCHRVEGLDAPFQGTLGPDLTGVGDRRSTGELRLIIADARRVYPGTIMPSYYRTTGLHQVASGFRGKPVLSAREVEDVTAYLTTLKSNGA